MPQINRRWATILIFVVAALWTTPVSAQVPSQGLLREVFENIGGSAVADLTNNAAYPNQPTYTNYVTDFFESPTDIREQYGQRMHGFVIAPTTGNYVFWIATDDGGSLFLSTDSDPAKKRLVAYVSGWTSSREWTREGSQQSAAIRLEAGQSYYIEALQKEEGGGDNLAVRWQLPSGTIEEPIPGSRLRPWGIAFTAPDITQHPQNLTVTEGNPATLAVRVSNVDTLFYQWQRGTVNIPGANGRDLLIDPALLSDDNSTYRCFLSNKLGTAFSNPATLRVTPDTTAPLLVSGMNASDRTIALVFSEAMEAASATSAGNYQITGGLTVTGAAFGADTKTIVLTVSAPLTYQTLYTVTVTGVRDRAATPNTIAAGAQISFEALPYVPADIGGTATVMYVAGGFDVSATGAEIGGSADQFHFDYQQRTGNFDLALRVQNFAGADMWSKAGLMARATLTANSTFAAAVATPSLAGAFSLTRPTTGANATQAGYAPVNYPQTWLRLARVGNNFSSYASIDGVNWLLLSTTSISMPATIFVGAATASHDATRTATAQFRDLGATPAGNIVTAIGVKGEPLAASSRRTGLVVSEIMYNPADRADGKNLEYIEFFNTDPVTEDLSGFRLSGALDYVFPAGTVLNSGAFLVLAKDPAAMRAVYGINNVMGGYAGELSNDSGVITVHTPTAMILEAHFSDKAGWPIGADGAGHALVLARPSYGEAQREAWSASALKGGSPGRGEPIRADAFENLTINEILAHTDEPQKDYLEIYNHSNVAVRLDGCFLTDSKDTNRFMFPANTTIAARGFLAVDQDALGFALSAAGERVYLVASNDVRVIDAVRFEGQQNGVSYGRYPDGGKRFGALQTITQGAANAAPAIAEVVINELMYHPISDNDDDEYVELFNRGAVAVDVSGWKFTDGIDFTFPEGSSIAAGGYLVVGKSLVRLRAKYPALNTANSLGDYDGTLSNSGERLALSKPDEVLSTNEVGEVTSETIYIAVSDVEYGEGGRWGQWADGGGSSMELVDPRADLNQPSSWADSNEEAKAAWTTIEFTGVLDNGGLSNPDQLQLLLQGGGECMVDDVEVRKTGSNLIVNSGFESDLAGWVAQGSFSQSAILAGAGFGGGKGLRVTSPVRGDTGANRIRYNLTAGALNAGETATLRAKVRWMKGYPEFLLRLRGSWLEAFGKLSLPNDLGTPGLPNSRSRANIGPSIYEVVHTPILPAGGEAVVVTAVVTDPDGFNAPQLKYRIDPAAGYSTVAMNDGGTNGDAVANDGLWSGRIPGQSSGNLAAFFVQASDRATTAVTANFPAEAPTKTCAVRWGETQPPATIASYRMWMTQGTINTWANREVLNNAPLDITFVYGNSRVVYNVGALYSGSPWHAGYNSPVGGMCDYVLNFREDELFLGATDFVMASVGNLDNDDTAQREQAAFWIMRQLGVAFNHRRFINLVVNGQQRAKVFEDAQQPNAHFVEGWFPDDADGELLKIEDWFEFADDGRNFLGNQDAQLGLFTTTGGAFKTARYRWNWRPRAVKKSANDFTTFFELVRAANDSTSAAAYATRLENVMDTENWMRVICVEHLVGNWDAYGTGRGKNMFTYRPSSGKWVLMPWDIDFVLGSGSDGPTSDMFGGINDGAIGKMINDPTFGPRFRRAYYRAMQDAVDGPLAAEKIGPVMDARYHALVANGVGVTSPASTKQYIATRRAQLQGLLGQVAAVFSITSNNGNNFNTNKNFITLTGKAPIQVKTIEVNGAAYPVTWTTVTNWAMSVPLVAASNPLTVQGYDLRGNQVGGASDTITIGYTGALTSPRDIVVFNEIMYNSAAPNASFIELVNTSTTAAFDLSGFRIDGVDFNFPDGSVIAPNGYLVIAKDAAAFSLAYGSGIPIVGVFAGSLDNGGERLKLIKPGAIPADDELIDAVRYDDDLPWPLAADGTGPSLQLIDPTKDNSRPANWAAQTTGVRFSPGAANSVKATLTAFPTIWINEVLPNNTNGLTDGNSEREPWIELYNSGATSVDLSALYLTDTYTNLLKWKFPAGATIGPSQFLLVWADNQPEQTIASAPHASFRLNPTNGAVALTRSQGAGSAVIDFINYNITSPNRSFGSYPEGQAFDRQLFHFPTPRETNDNRTLIIPITINEWMAGNTRTLADPADRRFDDWFELYNSGTEAVDLSGYYLTDNLTNWNQFRIPPGYIVPPQGYLVVWADSEANQNVSTNIDLHTNFKLAAGGEQIGLFGADGTQIDGITFGAQVDDVSKGRFPDGAAAPYFTMTPSTPRGPNSIPSGNQAPLLTGVDNTSIFEELEYRFTALGTDPDAGQTLTYSLIGGPTGAALDPTTGVFTWMPLETQAPATYPMTIRVTDNGSPALSRSKTFTLNVTEVNRAPVLGTTPEVAIDEQFPYSFNVPVTDPDLPSQPIFFFLDEGPVGASLNANTGRFDWTPSEAHGPGAYPVTIRVVDGGSPSLSATNHFVITVRDVNAPPQLAFINDQFVVEGDTLTVDASAVDNDLPGQALLFNLSGLPNAAFNTATGRLVWTPTAANVPSTNTVTIQVTDSGSPAQSASRTFLVVAAKANRPPVFTPMADISIDELVASSVQLTASDPDAGQLLTYTVLETVPAGPTVSSTGGLSWNPTEVQGPSTNKITFRIADNGSPSQSATGSVNVIVREINRPPSLTSVSEQTATQDKPFSVTVLATDPDRPNNTLRFTLEAPPEGAAIDATTGVFTWTPAARFANTTQTINVRVTDDGSPAASDAKSFTIRVLPPTVWKFASATGTASTSVIYVYLESPGEVIIDDLRVVAGTVPATGPNLLPNGDFESVLSPWTVSANHSASALTNIAHSGATGLRMVASVGGTTRDSSIFQTIAPALTAGANYTISYWYVPNTNDIRLTVRLSGNGIVSNTNILAAEPPPAIDLAATLALTGEIEFVWAARAGVNYRVYYRPDIEAGAWQTLTDLTATGATVNFRTPTNLGPARYYKVVALP